MAIAPTGNIFKGFVFDGESSKNYGIYITGEAVYNAPERDVEMITIPGRSGQFALDNGRFENIEVTYPAGIFANDETSFAEAVSDFRNILCSRKGYVRLTDEYNPNEYRLAVYKSGLEVSPAQLKAGEFEITFDCKPQRFLTSGEAAVTVTNGQTITNPTLFDASPLLEFEGYGDITFAGQTIHIDNAPFGSIAVCGSTTRTSNAFTGTLHLDNVNTGDSIFVDRVKLEMDYTTSKDPSRSIDNVVVRSATNATGTTSADGRHRTIQLNDITFTKGTDDSITGSVRFDVYYTLNGVSSIYNVTSSITVEYDASVSKIRFSITNNAGDYFTKDAQSTTVPTIYAYSTKSTVSGTAYIDLDIGEAWSDNGGAVTSLNNIVQMPAELPTLQTGGNTFTVSNTITSLKVTPRWWKV